VSFHQCNLSCPAVVRMQHISLSRRKLLCHSSSANEKRLKCRSPQGLPSSKGYYEGWPECDNDGGSKPRFTGRRLIIHIPTQAGHYYLPKQRGRLRVRRSSFPLSIVAREYGIPAVVAVEAPPNSDNTRIMVDGYTGDILITQ